MPCLRQEMESVMYENNRQVVGTCGNCGGAVVLPKVWMSVIPPVATCESCGATAAQNGPVLPMNPPPQQPPMRFTISDNTSECCVR